MKGSLVLALIATLLLATNPLAFGDPLATADGETPGTQVQIASLKRTGGDSVTMHFVLINNTDSSLDKELLYENEYRSVDGVYLVDPAGKKKYEVVHDSDKNCVCSRGLSDYPSKSSVNLWAKFPAPPADVQKVGVVVPHFIPMDDVPLQSQ